MEDACSAVLGTEEIFIVCTYQLTLCGDRYFGGTEIFRTSLSLLAESRNSSVTFRDLREAHVGIFTFGVKLGVAPHNSAQDLVGIT